MLIARTWPKDQSVPQVRNVRVDPNRLFHSISFDPRLISFEAKEREAEVRDAGYSGEIRPDQSYQKIVNLLEMRRRSEEHTSELQSLMRISYAVFCLKKKTQ